jgi:Trypsin-like peptidase domain
MMKFIGRILLCGLMVLALARATLAYPPVTARLDFDDGTCSGTVVAPTVILSAAHCFQAEENERLGFITPPPTEMKVDGYKVKILVVVFDDNDHAMVKVDFTFDDYARLGPRPDVGARVHYWGNPAKINNVYREGYVTSYHHSDMVMDINGFFGDSGAGIFSSSGKLVGVLSYLDDKHAQNRTFRLMGAQEIEFTALQYRMMGVTAP